MLKSLSIWDMLVPKTITFESRFVLYSSLIAAFFSLSNVFVNAALHLKLILIQLSGLSFLVYVSIYFLGRFSNRELVLKYMFSGYSLFIINMLWFLNYGTKGPAAFVYVIFYSLLTFIWDERMLIKITIVLLLNICVFFLIDYLYPNLTGDYPSDASRRIDFFQALLFFLGVIFLLSYSAKRFYRIEFENAKRSDRLKSAFLANMSHEIRTPLNSIVGFSELLCDTNMPDHKRDRFVHIIQDNNQNLLRLIDDILDISRIESNQLSINMEFCNVNELLSTIETSYKKHKLVEANPNVKVVFERSDQNVTIETDMSRFHQVMVNLLDNALKFTAAGTVRFGYTVSEEFIEVYVQDEGIGIRKENIPKLFERFFKIEHDDGNFYKGTGIGLSLCRDIVELLGGKIWVESEFGKGSNFYFTLPFKK